MSWLTVKTTPLWTDHSGLESELEFGRCTHRTSKIGAC